MAGKIHYLLLLLIVFSAKAQENQNETADSVNFELKPKFGLFGHYNFNLHTASFQKLPDTYSCCPEFTGGTGSGFSFGALFDYPLDEDFQLNLRLGFTHFEGLMASTKPENVIIDGNIFPGKFEYEFETQFGSLALEPMAGYRVMPDFFVHAGMRLGFFTNSNYYQVERIVEPSDRGVFRLEGTRYRNESSGDMEQLSSFQGAIRVGAGYHLPMNHRRTLFLVPEFFYNYNFTPVVDGLTWNIHTIQAGVAIKYREGPPPPPPPDPPLAPPVPETPLPEAPPLLTASVKAVEIDSNGRLNENFNIRIEDFVSYNMRPLLNYVFFAEGSYEIPKRYITLDREKTGGFSLKSLQNMDAIRTYYNVMNIIGKRLKDNPETTVKLIGTNSGGDVEAENEELSRERALSVREYIAETWGIERTRMPIESRNLPEKASRSDSTEGREENRRVEIIPSDDVLTDPVFTVDTMRIIATSTIRFLPEIEAEAGLKEWEIKAESGEYIMREFEGITPPEEDYDWKLTGQDAIITKNAGNVFYSISVRDSLGQVFTAPKKRLPVEQFTIDRKRLEAISDKEFEYYSLILFDYGKSELEAEHRNVVDFVKNRISEDAKITIRGYSDSMGEEDINRRISRERAERVADRLKIPHATVEGIGEDDLLYDNSTPEGRFYCRTVQIVIETPVKK